MPSSSIQVISSNPSRTAVASMVMERFDHSRNVHSSFHRKTVRWYDLWRGWYTGGFQPFRNNVSIPLVFSTIWSDVARKMNTSFGIQPWVNFRPSGPEDGPKARRTEALIAQQMKDSDSYNKAVDMFVSADLYGTAVMQIGWRQDVEKVPVRQQAPSLTGRTLEKILLEDKVTFDGPDWEVLDPLDFFPQPGVKRLDSMDWKIRRYWLDLDQVKQLAKQGLFDAEPVRQVEVAGLRERVAANFTQRRSAANSPLSREDMRKQDKHAKPVEIIEYWGRVPADMQMPDGATQRVISVANRAVVIRNRPLPFSKITDPFLDFTPLRDPHSFLGLGKAEVSEKLQFTANRFMNQKLDALDAFIDPFFIYDRNAGINPRELYMRAGRVFGVDGDPSKAVVPIFPNMQGLQFALGEVEQLWRWMQQGTGIVEDTVQGQAGPGNRTTAREFLGRQESVNTRLLLESRVAEEMWIEPMATKFHKLNQEFLEVPKRLRILGADQMIDPVTGQPVATDIGLDELNLDYDIMARGATQTMGKAQKSQNMALLLQASAAHPVGMQLVNWSAFFKQLFEASELDNPKELLNLTPEEQQAQRQALLDANGGGPQQQEELPGTPNEILNLGDLVGVGSPTLEAGVGNLAGTLGG